MQDGRLWKGAKRQNYRSSNRTLCIGTVRLINDFCRSGRDEKCYLILTLDTYPALCMSRKRHLGTCQLLRGCSWAVPNWHGQPESIHWKLRLVPMRMKKFHCVTSQWALLGLSVSILPTYLPSEHTVYVYWSHDVEKYETCMQCNLKIPFGVKGLNATKSNHFRSQCPTNIYNNKKNKRK